jgi:signal peptidase I
MRVAKDVWVPLRLREEERPLPEQHPLRWLYETAEVVVPALVVVVLLFTFAVRTVRVNGHSMDTTLRHGQALFAAVAARHYQHGQIVVIAAEGTDFTPPQPIIKRIIGLPGDEITIDYGTGTVYRNGKALREPYVREPIAGSSGTGFTVKVEPGTCFVMGDNRNRSTDSRDDRVGLVDMRALVGYIIFPLFPRFA